ncbi:MAG: hypothetical protein LBM19_04235 [Holosporales bacterium]|jgi:hypothetical protein|nr:hypothetical protein [Holosporales bacterium]
MKKFLVLAALFLSLNLNNNACATKEALIGVFKNETSCRQAKEVLCNISQALCNKSCSDFVEALQVPRDIPICTTIATTILGAWNVVKAISLAVYNFRWGIPQLSPAQKVVSGWFPFIFDSVGLISSSLAHYAEVDAFVLGCIDSTVIISSAVVPLIGNWITGLWLNSQSAADVLPQGVTAPEGWRNRKWAKMILLGFC